MAYTITKEYLDKSKSVTDIKLIEIDKQIEKLESRKNALIVQHAALICDYEEQESKRLDVKIITRQEAMAKGLKRYFTGLPCKQGHYSPRYVKGSQCLECIHGVPKHDDYELIKKQAKAKREVLDSMRIFKVRLVLNEHQKYLKAIVDMTNVDNPNFTLDDILVSKKPTHVAGGTGLFKIRAYPHHEQLLKNISDRSFTGL